MSMISGRTSLAAVVKSSLNRRSSLAPSKSHIFPGRVESALIDLLQKKELRSYEELVVILRDCALSDDELILVLSESSKCIGLLDRDARLLVEVLCNLDWPNRPLHLMKLFSQWFLDLLTAHIYHTPMAIGCFVKLLAKSDACWAECPSSEQAAIFSNVHNLIARVVAIIPMSGEILLECAVDNYPYYKHSAPIQQAYVHNLLWITRYLPALTDRLLALILNRLIVFDVNIRPQQESVEEEGDIFAMEQDIENDSQHLVEALDLSMVEIFQWLHQEGDKVLNILFDVFEQTILPTHGTRFIQFVFFYGLSMDKCRIVKTLEILWQMVIGAKLGPGLRQASIAHLSGLLARANFIPLLVVQNYVKLMSDWCHSYITAQDSFTKPNGLNPHAVFYSVCKSLFYLIAFKHNQIFSSKKGLVFVESLNLSKIVMSSLNPLHMCPPSVAEAFASITRMHQVVYCHTVMEHNARHYLKADYQLIKEQYWFPYDPYTLPRSYHWIRPFYSEYEDSNISDAELCREFTQRLGDDDDDFLATSPGTEQSHSLSKNSFKSFVRQF